MKTQAIILVLLFSLISIHGFSAKTNGSEQQETKKTTKTKYDFNIFKMFSIESTQPSPIDSTKLKSNNPYKRKLD